MFFERLVCHVLVPVAAVEARVVDVVLAVRLMAAPPGIGRVKASDSDQRDGKLHIDKISGVRSLPVGDNEKVGAVAAAAQAGGLNGAITCESPNVAPQLFGIGPPMKS
jgi:hypothetical protein